MTKHFKAVHWIFCLNIMTEFIIYLFVNAQATPVNQITATDVTTSQRDTTTSQTDMTTSQTDMTTSQTDMTTSQTDTTTSQTDMTTSQTDMTTSQTDTTTSQTDMTTSQTNTTTSQTDMTTSQTDMTTSQTDMTTSQTDTTTSQTDMTTSQTDMTTSQTDTTTSQTDMTTSQTDMTTSQTDMTTSQTDMTTSQTDMTTSQTDTTTSQTDMTTSQTDMTTLQTDTTTSQTDMTTSQTDMTTSQKDTTTSQTDMTTSQTDMTTSQTDTTASQTDMTTSQTDMTTSQIDMTTSQTDTTASQTDMTTSQTDMTTSQTDMTTTIDTATTDTSPNTVTQPTTIPFSAATTTTSPSTTNSTVNVTTMTTVSSTLITTMSSAVCTSPYTLSASLSPTVHYIMSPNYPNDYNNGMDCEWNIVAPTGCAVEVQFDTSLFVLENSKYCNYDYVILYDGDSSSTQINVFCGNTITNKIYKSSSDKLTVIFHSDDQISQAGFKLSYQAVDNTYPACKQSYTVYVATSSTNVISTPNFGISNYQSNTDIYWLMTNNNTVDFLLVLNIIDIAIEKSTDCLFDRLVIYDGSCQNNPVLDTVCGQNNKLWYLTGAEYLLYFHSDMYYNDRGFKMEYYYLSNSATIPPTTMVTTKGAPLEFVVNMMEEMFVDYAKDNAPIRDLGTPIGIYVDFYLVQINDLDEVAQKLTTTVQLDVKWTDSNLEWDPKRKSDIKKLLIPQDDLWRPDVALMNGFTKITEMGASFMFVDLYYNGTALWKPYQIIESVCQVDITYYPYDTQTCSLKFGMWSSTSDDLQTILGQNGLQIHSNFEENDLWRLKGTHAEQETLNSKKTVRFQITLERNPAYVLFYLVTPTIMLAYLNAFTFVIPSETGEKSGYCVTVFLSFVVLMIVTNGKMPQSSDSISLYATYVLCMTMMSAAAVILSAFQIRMLTYDKRRYPVTQCLLSLVSMLQIIKHKFFCLIPRHKVDENIHIDIDRTKGGSGIRKILVKESRKGGRSHKNITRKSRQLVANVASATQSSKPETQMFDRVSKTRFQLPYMRHNNIQLTDVRYRTVRTRINLPSKIASSKSVSFASKTHQQSSTLLENSPHAYEIRSIGDPERQESEKLFFKSEIDKIRPSSVVNYNNRPLSNISNQFDPRDIQLRASIANNTNNIDVPSIDRTLNNVGIQAIESNGEEDLSETREEAHSWRNVVNFLDVVLFLVYMFVTTLITVCYFVTMVTSKTS